MKWLHAPLFVLVLAGCLDPSDRPAATTDEAVAACEAPGGGSVAAENETYAFDGDFTTGAYVSGNYRLLQRAVYPFVVPAGATSIRATLTFDARAGDLDFHLETPEPIIYGDGSGHGGTAAAPEAGVIDVPAEDAVAGNWTVVVHTGEAEPASFNLDGSYRIDVVVTILRAAPPLRC